VHSKSDAGSSSRPTLPAHSVADHTMSYRPRHLVIAWNNPHCIFVYVEDGKKEWFHLHGYRLVFSGRQLMARIAPATAWLPRPK
jgi:hypothetical protein